MRARRRPRLRSMTGDNCWHMLPRSARAPRRPTNQRRRCHCRRSSYTFAAHARTAAARLPSLRRHQLAIVSLRNRPKARQRRRFVRTSRTRLLVSAGFRRKTLNTEYRKYNILVRDYHRPSSVRRVFVCFFSRSKFSFPFGLFL